MYLSFLQIGNVFIIQHRLEQARPENGLQLTLDRAFGAKPVDRNEVHALQVRAERGRSRKPASAGQPSS